MLLTKCKRVVLIVLDSVGIGALPDAHLYGDERSNTLGHIAERCPDFKIPNLIEMGLGNIDPDNALESTLKPLASYGKANQRSQGKDTTTGHWEICGSVLEQAFPVFPNGFPKRFMERFESAIGTRTMGNKSASGTVIINELGEEHLSTGYPIVYTSADSVFQIAMHEDMYPIDRQYEICQAARDMLVGDYAVGRVISRPFEGVVGSFVRTSRRRDFSLLPPDNVLDAIVDQGLRVVTIGKIADIFAGKGISTSVKTKNNIEGIEATIAAIEDSTEGLIFTNLVDFDMLYGHRRDVEGYGQCLMQFDSRLPDILDALKDDDLLILTADHGNDPTAPGSDHTREYIPILCYAKGMRGGKSIGVRDSFADIGATIAAALWITYETRGSSFYSTISNGSL